MSSQKSYRPDATLTASRYIKSSPRPRTSITGTGDNVYAQTVAEKEWLQEEVTSVSPDHLKTTPTPRFDWRLRASSRTPIPRDADKHVFRRHYTKRFQPPYAEVRGGEPFFDEIQSYQDKFLKLLDAEQAEDEAILKERLSTWTLSKLKEEGYCLTGLSAFWLQANQFGRPVAAFLLGPGLALPDHGFENGTQVFLSRLDPLQEKPALGNVVARTTTQLKVSFQETFDLEEGPWRLDVGHSNIVFRRMQTAISHLHHDPVSQELAPQLPDRQLILRGTHLRDVLLRAFSLSPSSLHPPLREPNEYTHPIPETLGHSCGINGDHKGAFNEDARIMSWARRYRDSEPIRIDGDPVLSGLNPTQVKAIAMMIGERISLLQGPPGTGKTKTIIEAIHLLKVYFEVPHPTLVCTYTNVAVDNLVEGLALSGIKPLRIGFAGKVKSSLIEYTLEHKLETHPLKPEFDKLSRRDQDLQKHTDNLRRKLDELRKGGRKQPREIEDKEQESLAVMERKHWALKARLYACRQQMLREVVAEADVICTTCITSACVALDVIDFPVVFLDEASMSTEPASLIPIMKGSRHVALIGDHKQLPPVIKSDEAQAMGLGESLFERLTKEGVVPSMMLDVQYRMHPSISRFPSSEFYNFRLQDGTVDCFGNIPSRLVAPVSQHLHMNSGTGRPSVVFLDHGGLESKRGRSKVNMREGHIVCSVVEDLLLSNEYLRGEDIGIIAPYVAQISLLTQLLQRDAAYRERFKSVLGEYRAMQLAKVEINTVDGFEGREKDVIVFSTVRNNEGGYIGFLADRRRLNVGLTRAKRGLFVVGNINTVRSGKMGERCAKDRGKGADSWRRYAQYLKDEGLVVGLYGERLRSALYGNVKRVGKGHEG